MSQRRGVVGWGLCALAVSLVACGGDSGETPTQPPPTEPPPGPTIDEEGSWTRVAPLRQGVIEAGVATYRGQIYVAGGLPDSLLPPSTAFVQRYDPGTNQWTRLNDLPEAIAGLRLTVFRDTLLLVGGDLSQTVSSHRPSDAVLAYDPGSDSWSEWARLPEPRDRPRLVHAGGRLVVLAGGGRPVGDSVIVIADAEQLYHVAPPPDGLPGNTLAASIADRAFVVTHSPRGPMFEFDVDAGSWNRVDVTMANLDFTGVGTGVGRRFHVAARDKHWAWEVDEPSWKILTPPPEHRFGAVLAAIGDSLFHIGGGDERSNRAVRTVDLYIPPR